MIELLEDQLVFSFPEVHPQARLTITFQRTLRIPDDGRTYPLPPGLGSFPMRHVDDLGRSVPISWIRHGGVLLPMHQSEALWINFNSDYIDQQGSYPFAVKVATGKINAVSGDAWKNELSQDPQDYVVAPTQPWLDGYCVERGMIRQFVAMPLGEGYTAEEQLTGSATHGGLQIIAYPMKRDAFEEYFPKIPITMRGVLPMDTCHCLSLEPDEMGLAPGGKMRQEIYDDPYRPSDWHEDTSRCFVHICNSRQWQGITGTTPPPTPVSAKSYTDAGLPWFECYGDAAATIEGSDKLQKLTSVADMLKSKQQELEGNEPVAPQKIHICERQGNRVREGEF